VPTTLRFGRPFALPRRGHHTSTRGLGQTDLAALGRIALISTRIQMVIELMIWELLGVEETAGRAITDRASPSWLVDRLKRLAKLQP
jgi:hypothetical protein